jgi:hypothetical protein
MVRLEQLVRSDDDAFWLNISTLFIISLFLCCSLATTTFIVWLRSVPRVECRWEELPASLTDPLESRWFQDCVPLYQHEEVLMDVELERPQRWSQELDDATRLAHPSFEVPSFEVHLCFCAFV